MTTAEARTEIGGNRSEPDRTRKELLQRRVDGFMEKVDAFMELTDVDEAKARLIESLATKFERESEELKRIDAAAGDMIKRFANKKRLSGLDYALHPLAVTYIAF